MGKPNKRQKSGEEAATPSKKAKKEVEVKVEAKEEIVKKDKKIKKKEVAVEVEKNAETPKKENKKPEKPAEPATEKTEELKGKKGDKKGKKQTKKEKKPAATSTVVTLPTEKDGYVAGALSALFGGSTEKSEAAEDLFGKYAEGESGFVDTPTVIETPAKKEVVNTREKQRENRKKNADERELVDEKKRTAFVGNLPVDYTRKQLHKLFADCGQIDSVRIRGTVGSKETLSKKTAFLAGKVNENIKCIIGYVKFVSPDTVAKAIEKNGTVVDGHRIHVDGCIGIKNYDRKATVFIGNLPFEISDDEVASWAEENIGPVDFVRLVRDKNTGYGRGIGFITFKENACVALALKMEKPKIGEAEVRFQKVMKKSEKKDVLKNNAERVARRKQRKIDRKGKKAAGATGGGKAGAPVNPLLGEKKTGHASKKVQKEIKKRRKMAGPKSLMK